jgi:CheY-like chemotaxis protein
MNDDVTFSELLSRIRHDLRTPVGHIIGYAEMMDDELAGSVPDEFVRDLRAIKTSGEHLVAMIEEHLGASKRSTDDLDLPEAQFQLRMQLNHISGYSEMCREVAEEEGWTEPVADLDRIAAAEARMLELLEQRLSDDAFEVGSAIVAFDAAGDATELELHALAQGGAVLVVDDDPTDQDLLRRRLTRHGFDVSVATDSASALDRSASGDIDIILLDLLMKEESGLEILRQLKSGQATRHIPVIMLSAMDDLEPMVACVLAGAEDYILKPIHPVLLRARIGASLEKVRLRKRFSRQLRIFISSPGDVIPERQLVKQVISELDDEFGDVVQLVPVLWEEEPLLASETFQSQIIAPRDTDVYVAILWSRLGSPLPDSIVRPDGTVYESGTAFEFEDAMDGFQVSGRPQMLMYRKDGAPSVSLAQRDAVLDRLDQMDRVTQYIDRWFTGDDGSFVAAFHHFSDPGDLEAMVKLHLRKLIAQWVATSAVDD